jgi:cyclin B
VLGIPIDKKIKKENPINKIKNYQQIANRKKKKESSNSLHKKASISNSKICSNKNSKEKLRKESSKIKNKNRSQKNILPSNRTININDDIIMKDENINPNILTKIYSSNRNNTITTINRSTHKLDDDVEMKIENNINQEKKVKTKINIQNADEYFNDIYIELLKNEEKFLVDPNYMSNQSDINHRMRAILIDWLIDVHLKYKLVPQTMYIAVNLIDRYLEKNETTRAKLQLVGVTAMFIACKYEEIYPPELKDFVYITDGAYVKADVLNMEYKMLKSLDFNVTFPTQWSIFEIYKKKLDLNEKTFKFAWFLMELCLIDYNTLKFKMSELAASAILIASKTLGVYRNNWFTKNIGIEEKKLEECCKEIYNYYEYNSTHNLQAIRRKFSSSKFDEVAKIKLL